VVAEEAINQVVTSLFHLAISLLVTQTNIRLRLRTVMLHLRDILLQTKVMVNKATVIKDIHLHPLQAIHRRCRLPQLLVIRHRHLPRQLQAIHQRQDTHHLLQPLDIRHLLQPLDIRHLLQPLDIHHKVHNMVKVQATASLKRLPSAST